MQAITIETTTQAGDMQALLAGIEARSKALNKTTEDSTVAAGITILRSLKSATKTAPKKATENMYQVVCQAYDAAGWRGRPARRRPVVDGQHLKALKPVNLMYGLRGNGHLYRVFFRNELIPKKAWKNYPYIFLLAPNDTVAKNYAKLLMERVLRRESGMARSAIGIAQAKASTMTKILPPEQFHARGLGTRASALAYAAGVVKASASGFSSGAAFFSFLDNLRYSLPASGGENALAAAMAKAANSMLGAYGDPAIKQALEDLRIHNPEAKFVDIFKKKFAA